MNRALVMGCVVVVGLSAVSCGSDPGTTSGAMGASPSGTASPATAAAGAAVGTNPTGSAGTSGPTTMASAPAGSSAAAGSAAGGTRGSQDANAALAGVDAGSATASGGAEATSADASAGQTGQTATDATDPSDTGAFPPVTDFMNNGPFTSATLDATGPNNNYTVYYPTELAPGGAGNPIVGWMSGGGTNPALYPLLPLLASHGFVVVASNTVPGIGEEASLGKEIIAGIDWAIAENDRDGSMFYQKLDTTKLASTGYSMGSLATFQIAGDPRLVTTVHISGGNMAPEPIHNLHAPAAFLCGIPGDDTCDILSDTCDIAAANCDIDFNAATTPVFYANFSGGHLGILTPPLQEQIQTEVVAWLRWQLMGDATIRSRFVGEQCGVCQDDRWKVQQKNLN